jgi:hypothetical protein
MLLTHLAWDHPTEGPSACGTQSPGRKMDRKRSRTGRRRAWRMAEGIQLDVGGSEPVAGDPLEGPGDQWSRRDSWISAEPQRPRTVTRAGRERRDPADRISLGDRRGLVLATRPALRGWSSGLSRPALHEDAMTAALADTLFQAGTSTRKALGWLIVLAEQEWEPHDGRQMCKEDEPRNDGARKGRSRGLPSPDSHEVVA